MLRLEKLSYRIGGRLLLDQADAAIAAGHRVGLVGRNGSGKTTLLRLICGELEADGGRIELPPRWRIGLTRQEAPSGSASLLATVLAADSELVRLHREAATAEEAHHIAAVHERLAALGAHGAEARAARILKGLGFDDEAQKRPCAALSGGMRMRVALAALLFQAPDLLLLDEPTNHLDLEASLWLEEFLRAYPGTVLIVSHDRHLLNRVVGEILLLEGGKLSLYAGGYDRFEEARRLRADLSAKARRRQEAEKARIRAFVDRFRYKASKARQAQSRLKWLERMQPIAEAREDEGIGFEFPDPEPLPPPILGLNGVDVGYDGRPILRRLTLRLDADDRIALLGANGNGKSTLIKLLAGRLAPLKGEVVRSPRLRVGYFAQHQAEEFDLAATPLVELARRHPRQREEWLRAHLGRFGFSQERAETRVGDLSGGEKARLLFAVITSERPHLLLLDEPTNHLDVAARQALVEGVNAFQGAVVLVSHDAHLIELTADRLWLVADGGVQAFDGDLEEYRAEILAGGRHDGAPSPPAASGRRLQRRAAAVRRAALAPLKKQVAEAEAEIDRLARERQQLAAALAAPDLYAGDPGRLVTLQKQLAGVERQLTAAETRWLDLHAAWEAAGGSV